MLVAIFIIALIIVCYFALKLYVLFYKIFVAIDRISRTITTLPPTEYITKSEIIEVLKHHRLAQKKDYLCLTCTHKECMSHKNEYFICGRYKDNGIS